MFEEILWVVLLLHRHCGQQVYRRGRTLKASFGLRDFVGGSAGRSTDFYDITTTGCMLLLPSNGESRWAKAIRL